MNYGNTDRRTKGSDPTLSTQQGLLEAVMELTALTRSRHLTVYQRDALLNWLQFTKRASEAAERLAPDEESKNRMADICTALLAIDQDIMDDITDNRDPVPRLVDLLNRVSQAIHSPPVSTFPLIRIAFVMFQTISDEIHQHNTKVLISRDRVWEAHHGEHSRDRPASFASGLTMRYLDPENLWPLSDAFAQILSKSPFFRRVLLSNELISQDADEEELLRLARALTELILMQQDVV